MMALSALRPSLKVFKISIKERKEVLNHIRFNIVHRYQECAKRGK